MKIKVTKSKPIAKALIIKSKGSLPLDKSPLGSLMSGPMDSLISSLMKGPMSSGPRLLSGMTSPLKGSMGDPEYDDKRMVMHALRSMRAIIDELEDRACGCEPMPSWAEAKIYAAQKDILTVLGALMGRED
jgi:hypothetical protein